MKALNNEIGDKLEEGGAVESMYDAVDDECLYDVPETVKGNNSSPTTTHYNIVSGPPRAVNPRGAADQGRGNVERSEGVGGVYRNTDENYLFENVEYVDNNLIQQAIRSKSDGGVESIALTASATVRNSPSPKPRSKPEAAMGRHKVTSQSVRLPGEPGSPRKVPPKPKPRPSTQLYESPSALNINNNDPQHKSADELSVYRGGSVREMAAQMSVKIQPASLVPTMTQAKLEQQEKSAYQNLR